MTVSLFDYPPVRLRKHAPKGYATYDKFKPWIRDEFEFRCVYCLERERWYPNSLASLSIDHVVAQVKDKTRIVDYDNTVYACSRCNSAKQQNTLIDPTVVSFADHLGVMEDGKMVHKSPEGFFLIELLHLNRDDPLRTRRARIKLLLLKQKYPADAEIHDLYLDAFGYPTDLPDLAPLRPPEGNALSANIRYCHHERKVRNELPEVY